FGAGQRQGVIANRVGKPMGQIFKEGAPGVDCKKSWARSAKYSVASGADWTLRGLLVSMIIIAAIGCSTSGTALVFMA
ncbi:MAG: hypothetical protein AAF850_10495, partial [Pseudomonadota bacterium]